MTQKWTHRYEIKPGRWVFAPTKEARKAGDRIKRQVARHWKPPAFYFHLRDGGHVAAVRLHTPNKFFYRVDLDDFFGRVNRSRVTRCLKSWFSYAEAREMASESVVKRPSLDGFVLPYGFVQSPLLASLALDRSRLGSYLRSLSGQGALAVSVYVDDIIVSGQDEKILLKAAVQLTQMAESARFPINVGKQEGPAKTVTAFNIQMSHAAMRITQSRLDKLQEVYQATVNDYCKAGILSYVQSVNPAQAKLLQQEV